MELQKSTLELKTFEDACKVLNLEAEKIIPDFSCFPESEQKALIAHAKLIIVAKAANFLENDNKEWFPDWSNFDENKYYPWFDLYEGSSGFRAHGYVDWRAYSVVGSRLCFKSRELAKYIGNQFVELYKDYFIK